LQNKRKLVASSTPRKVRVCFICPEHCANTLKRCTGIAGVAEFVDDAAQTDVFVVTNPAIAHGLAEAGNSVILKEAGLTHDGLNTMKFVTESELVNILQCIRLAVSYAESRVAPATV
jgi:hypothetical protein